MSTKQCPFCGAEIDSEAVRCNACQKWLNENTEVLTDDRPQEFLPTLLFAWFCGAFGIHRFYTGNILIGVAQFLTLGGCGIWAYVDFIMICFNQFRDGQGRLLRNYDKNIGITLFVLSLIPVIIILFLVLLLCFAVTLPALIH